ncbi:tyrosine-type recombinase/integrase [Chitinophaga pendula]|uniref:tyrosine-type recombinase/integrase n=1 Tax=Chitinophaga TaxID=79328 RepID=UPI000BB048B3|nr:MULTISPECIES: tyrosine-type recombinase/integrase [Chitinophaga]ASZ10853.1 integrase [Chitinophaga sp. MD30]UCJ06165.1 tyrosine-type recombinase/integrase [Chitinophaga pendula]
MMTLQQYLAQHYTPGTAASYEREISCFLSGCPGAETALYSDLIAYVGQLRQRYSNASTLNRIVSSIKAYYDYLCQSGIREDHPGRALLLRDQRSRDIQLQDLFTSGELAQLLARTSRYSLLAYRNKVLISLLVYQGLQTHELAGLKVTEVNLEAGSIYIRSSAAANSRTLSLQPNQVLLLYSYQEYVRLRLLRGKISDLLLLGQRGEGMSAQDISKHIKRLYGDMYAPRAVTAQTIRQSVLANLFKQGHDIATVQQFAGHKYPSSTERYRQEQVDRLQSAIDTYHPMK